MKIKNFVIMGDRKFEIAVETSVVMYLDSNLKYFVLFQPTHLVTTAAAAVMALNTPYRHRQCHREIITEVEEAVHKVTTKTMVAKQLHHNGTNKGPVSAAQASIFY